MATIRLDVITAERVVYSDDVDLVVVPGSEGQLGILPHHAPLMTTLQMGELWVRKGGEEFSLAIHGGFLEVRPDRVIVLADAAEKAEEINIARAEEAKHRAEEALKHHPPEVDATRVEAALRRALTRLKVVEKRKRRPQA
ncbi:MAG: F0F1 ATP synthase subunit epsilon [Dehalococcoidales bacterium]|nr:F0F1 ATP synthase subunit epsilon [Dehalococcoidales bacterium]